LIVAVATNSSKSPLFSIEERVDLIRASLGALSDGRHTAWWTGSKARG